MSEKKTSYFRSPQQTLVLKDVNPSFFKKLWEKIKWLRWTTLDGYIMKRFLMAIFGSLLMFVALYELTQIVNEMQWLPEGLETGLLIQKFFFDAVYWILILQPFSFLFATVFVFSKMANTRELIAMVSTGISMYRTTFYPLLFTVLYYLLLILFIENAVFFPSYQRKTLIDEMIYSGVDPEQLDQLKDNSNFSIFGQNDTLYIVTSYSAVSKELTDLTVVQFYSEEELSNLAVSEAGQNSIEFMSTNITEIEEVRGLDANYEIRIKLRIDADRAIWDSSISNWQFEDGTIRYSHKEMSVGTGEVFDEEVFDFIAETPDFFEKEWYPVDAMKTHEAKAYVERLKLTKQEWQEAETRRLSKFSYSLSLIIVVLAGVGIINISSRKASFIINLFLSLTIFIVYYVFFAMGIALAGKGVATPWVAAFLGVFLMGSLGIFLYSRTKT